MFAVHMLSQLGACKHKPFSNPSIPQSTETEDGDKQHLVATYVNYGNIVQPTAMSSFQPSMVGNTNQQHTIFRSSVGIVQYKLVLYILRN